MNQPQSPAERIHAAYTALQEARKAERAAIAAVELERKNRTPAEPAPARDRLLTFNSESLATAQAAETAARIVSMLELDMLSTCRNHGRGNVEPFTHRAELETIHDRRHGTTNPHARAIHDTIGTYDPRLDLEQAARLIHAWSEYKEACRTQRAVMKLQRETQPPACWYVDTERADNDRADAWRQYRATPHAPASLEPYAWPGGYPLYYLLEQQHEVITLCPTCAADEEPNGPIHQEANYENPDLYCDECSKRIESAYAEDAPDEHETRLNIWAERDRISVSLEDRRTDQTLVTLWDSAVHEAIESGELTLSNSRPHYSSSQLESDSVLHASLYAYAKAAGMLDRDYKGDRDIHGSPVDAEEEDAADAADPLTLEQAAEYIDDLITGIEDLDADEYEQE
jgi:hypothetical protein